MKKSNLTEQIKGWLAPFPVAQFFGWLALFFG